MFRVASAGSTRAVYRAASVEATQFRSAMFNAVKPGPPDPMYAVKKACDEDGDSRKVDLGVGIYRNEEGLYHELDALKKAKLELDESKPGHDYELTTGNPPFLKIAAEIMLGSGCKRRQAKEVASVQTISGTGANHLAALLLSKCISPKPKIYVGTPAWGNYKPLFETVGLEVVEYTYYNWESRTIDMPSIMEAINSAPSGSAFVLQGCCHNPVGADPSKEQWQEIGRAMRERKLVPFFDVAYQGLGDGLEEDVFAVRHFANMGFEMFVCQSFSKNFGIYGERCGVLHVLCDGASVASNVQDRLRSLIRWEFSSSPAYGARLVRIVHDSDELSKSWKTELSSMRTRMQALRKTLHGLLTKELKTPGTWDHILDEAGLFSILKLSPEQCRTLISDYHIYLPQSGRINISGLNSTNVEYVAKAIDSVVRAG